MLHLDGTVSHSRKAGEHAVLRIFIQHIEVAHHHNRLVIFLDLGRELNDLTDPVWGKLVRYAISVARMKMRIENGERPIRALDAHVRKALPTEELAVVELLGIATKACLLYPPDRARETRRTSTTARSH